ncbi:signal peptide peptidase SppA [Marinomonas sp. A79]|uniref:Signal peptide peptidase SppA n=1 Tax=Marinomonas vulgaris TaxID=2823372 RepID=A0ABS5HAC3_9GAMM|nr:signal peptide peptidase SppA [Marinomonas vulgaris]MBR7888420.1 signal peptide peptidase SppA [Marinomonas vulgaris]
MSWTEDEDRKAELQASNQDASTDNEASKKQEERAELDPNKAIWSLLEKTLSENLIEKRRARRWKIFFRLFTFMLVIAAGAAWFAKANFQEVSLERDVVAMIPMRGVIGSEAAIEASTFVNLLDDAYQNHFLQGVVIEMNSPGGSPVHSGIIYDAIRSKQQAYPQIPILVVVEDMAASGGYYIASAANEIYADKASLVGSIGVISSGFDASQLLEKIGVERRTFTAGRNKAFLDPFAPMTEEAQQKWQAVLNETHQQFISAVKEGRGSRLTVTDDVFSGMVFTGAQAVDIGLIDGLSSVNTLLNNRFPNALPVFYRPSENAWEVLAKELGVKIATKVLSNPQLH